MRILLLCASHVPNVSQPWHALDLPVSRQAIMLLLKTPRHAASHRGLRHGILWQGQYRYHSAMLRPQNRRKAEIVMDAIFMPAGGIFP